MDRLTSSTLVPGARPIGSGRYLVSWLTVTLFVGTFYFWQIGAAFDRFVWSDRLDGFYDLLARGFLNGHLYLPVDPRPELLALPNPWEAPANRPFRLLDAALYKKRYYMYHGVAPVLFLFTPWRLITGHDLPQDIAVFLFCLGGYVFLSVLLIELLRSRGDPVPLWLFLLFIVALGFAQCVPFLLQLTLMYEVAIASGYFCLSAGFFFLFKTLVAPGSARHWAFLCGMFFGLAVGCRPHLGLAILPSFFFIFMRQSRSQSFLAALIGRDLLAFSVPVVICGIAIASYNYARFDNPFEFGVTYLLGEPVYQNVRLATVNVLPGIYYMLACAPDLDAVFPFFRLARRPPFNSVHWPFPSRYFLEPTTGAIFLYPLALMALAAPVFIRIFRDRQPASAVIASMYTYSIACILFIAATGLNSQRFEVDFLPFLVFISCALLPEQHFRLRGAGRFLWSVALLLTMIYSVTINLLYAVQGPFDQWLRNKPAEYIRVARWFSPVERFRPVLNPWVHVKAYFDFPKDCAPGPFHPLIGLGKFGSRYMLSAACIGSNRLVLYSDEFYNVRTAETTLDHGGFHLVEIEFRPADRIMNVSLDNKTILRHPLDYLITAPSQIKYGLDETYAFKHRFDGRISVVGQEMAAQPPR